MNSLFKWEGTITVNGITYENMDKIPPNLNVSGGLNILLSPRETTVKTAKNASVEEVNKPKEFVITVKTYMTKMATPEFNFMEKWNNNIPMPLRTMVGTVEKETKGMVYMKLHGDLLHDITPRCLKCGKPITNPVSQYFGMGPECGGHNYTHPFETEEELKQAVSKYKKVLQKTTWEGWLPKSSIVESEEI